MDRQPGMRRESRKKKNIYTLSHTLYVRVLVEAHTYIQKYSYIHTVSLRLVLYTDLLFLLLFKHKNIE